MIKCSSQRQKYLRIRKSAGGFSTLSTVNQHLVVDKGNSTNSRNRFPLGRKGEEEFFVLRCSGTCPRIKSHEIQLRIFAGIFHRSGRLFPPFCRFRPDYWGTWHKRSRLHSTAELPVTGFPEDNPGYGTDFPQICRCIRGRRKAECTCRDAGEALSVPNPLLYFLSLVYYKVFNFNCQL